MCKAELAAGFKRRCPSQQFDPSGVSAAKTSVGSVVVQRYRHRVGAVRKPESERGQRAHAAGEGELSRFRGVQHAVRRLRRNDRQTAPRGGQNAAERAGAGACRIGWRVSARREPPCAARRACILYRKFLRVYLAHTLSRRLPVLGRYNVIPGSVEWYTHPHTVDRFHPTIHRKVQILVGMKQKNGTRLVRSRLDQSWPHDPPASGRR